MSLIQEALKRQQMELDGTVPPPAGTTAASSTEAPEPTISAAPGASVAPPPEKALGRPALQRTQKQESQETVASTPPPESRRVTPSAAESDDEGGNKTRVIPVLALVVLVLILLVGGVSWALMYGLELAGIKMPWADRAPVSEEASTTLAAAVPEKTDTTTAPKVEAPVAVTSAEPAKEPPAKTTIGSKVRAVVSEANAASHQTDEVITGAADATPAADVAKEEPAGPAVKSPAVKEAAAVAVAEPPVVHEPVIWPDLTVTGVVGKELKGAAFINGKVVGVNEVIQEVRVIAIKQQGALLEYKGETLLAKVGQPINRASR